MNTSRTRPPASRAGRQAAPQAARVDVSALRRRAVPSLGRRGSITGYAAIMLIVLVGFAGFAIDLQRAWLVHTRLKTAVDAAALAAARDFDNVNRDANARLAFTANINPTGGVNVAFGSDVSTPTIQQIDTDKIRITATATVPKTLFRVMSSSSLTLTETTLAQRRASGLELALVLDATGSMSQTDSVLGITKIQAAKNAISTMLDVLYGTEDTQRNLWVSVVPFSRNVNIGTSAGAQALLNTTTPAMPTGWNIANWNGCVEARSPTGNFDMNDAAPDTNSGKFRPYFWRSTFQQYGTVAGGQCTNSTDTNLRQAYDAVSGTRWCMGDNDWGQTTALLAQNHVYRTYQANGVPTPAGPNLFCTTSVILPLTASKATVMSAVNAITTPARSGGTIIPPGLHAGWLTLAPTWRGYWPGIADATLPMDYNSRNMKKVLILLSDGANNWQGWQTNFTSPSNGNVQPERGSGEVYYGAYGRALDQRLTFTVSTSTSTTSANANTALNTRMVAICNAMKASPYNIQIYVIGFEVANSTNRTNLQNCSSGAANFYFESPSASTLQSTFRTIGGRLANLRLAE